MGTLGLLAKHRFKSRTECLFDTFKDLQQLVWCGSHNGIGYRSDFGLSVCMSFVYNSKFMQSLCTAVVTCCTVFFPL